MNVTWATGATGAEKDTKVDSTQKCILGMALLINLVVKSFFGVVVIWHGSEKIKILVWILS